MTDLKSDCTAFLGHDIIARGPLIEVAEHVKAVFDTRPGSMILIFEDDTGASVQLDLRGDWTAVRSSLTPSATAPAEPARAGRPKLGVTAREVTLLPRHWEWLADQPGGASAAIRRLVEEARRTHAPLDRFRKAQRAADRVMYAMAGDLPGFEEALRAFYAGDAVRFEALIAAWPGDLGGHVSRLAATARTLEAQCHAPAPAEAEAG